MPQDYNNHLHIHVLIGSEHYRKCGGCRVLHSLYEAVKELDVSASESASCPSDDNCTGPGHRSHAQWILVPFGKLGATDVSASWRGGGDDMVFHYPHGCAKHPNTLPSSNFLQIITSPKLGDQTDGITFPLKVNKTGIA
mmetsp:Transcript_2085/g.3795  ORF Transcript_2085/g.3795 Transcript_2085/m.3795 type:complete len:139 (-) Transcript_2085:549-965(-)